MFARLGNVLYWIGCGLAVLAIAGAIAVAVIPSNNPHDKPAVPLFLAGIGLIVWLIGRGLKYILAGR